MPGNKEVKFPPTGKTVTMATRATPWGKCGFGLRKQCLTCVGRLRGHDRELPNMLVSRKIGTSLRFLI